MSAITNKEAADVLFNVATILELAEDNPYRIRAYRRAARLLLRRPIDAKVALVEGKDGKELDLPGLGTRLRRKLGELLATGRMKFYVEICADLPREIASLMQVPGVGPKTARRLHEELGVSDAAGLLAASRAGKVRDLYGFGQVREHQLREGAAAVVAGHTRSFVPQVDPELLSLAPNSRPVIAVPRTPLPAAMGVNPSEPRMLALPFPATGGRSEAA